MFTLCNDLTIFLKLCHCKMWTWLFVPQFRFFSSFLQWSTPSVVWFVSNRSLVQYFEVHTKYMHTIISSSSFWIQKLLLSSKWTLMSSLLLLSSSFTESFCNLHEIILVSTTRIILKGQWISKQIYEVIVSPKIRTKYFKDFCPSH